MVLYMTEPDFLKTSFYPQNWENRPSLGFLECIGKFSFFSQLFNFFSTWPIMKVYITVIAVCLNKNFIFVKIMVPEIWSKMLLANQIVGFFSQCRALKLAVSHED